MAKLIPLAPLVKIMNYDNEEKISEYDCLLCGALEVF
jgi:hypothetical protein